MIANGLYPDTYDNEAPDAFLNLLFVSEAVGSDVPADATLQAKYYYYLHGPLKRIELGGNRQGIDFTYNIHGWLTAINDPNDAADENPWFEDDAFGVAFNYYGHNPGVPDSAVAGLSPGGGLYGSGFGKCS